MRAPINFVYDNGGRHRNYHFDLPRRAILYFTLSRNFPETAMFSHSGFT